MNQKFKITHIIVLFCFVIFSVIFTCSAQAQYPPFSYGFSNGFPGGYRLFNSFANFFPVANYFPTLAPTARSATWFSPRSTLATIQGTTIYTPATDIKIAAPGFGSLLTGIVPPVTVFIYPTGYVPPAPVPPVVVAPTVVPTVIAPPVIPSVIAPAVSPTVLPPTASSIPASISAAYGFGLLPFNLYNSFNSFNSFSYFPPYSIF